MEAIILVGGKGTRLRTLVPDVPKPLAPIVGTPFLFYLLKELEKQKVQKVVLATGFEKEKISEFVRKTSFAFEILFSEELEPLGTGGALREALKKADGNSVLALNGDTFFPVPLKDLLSFHDQHQFDLTLSLKKIEEASRYGSVQIENHKILKFIEKSQTAGESLINGGVMVINKQFFMINSPRTAFSLEQDFFSKIPKIGGVEFSVPFIDIGVPEDYSRAQMLIPKWAAD